MFCPFFSPNIRFNVLENSLLICQEHVACDSVSGESPSELSSFSYLLSCQATEETATALKEEGNRALHDNHFEQATEYYTQALALHPTAVLYSNRAMAAIKMENYGIAIQDAEEAIALDPGYLKAFYRRGSAKYALGKVSYKGGSMAKKRGLRRELEGSGPSVLASDGFRSPR